LGIVRTEQELKLILFEDAEVGRPLDGLSDVTELLAGKAGDKALVFQRVGSKEVRNPI
jgi:hypothetical protein